MRQHVPISTLAAAVASLLPSRSQRVRLARFDPTVAAEFRNSLRSPTSASGVQGQDHDILADRLDDADDPRATLVRRRFTHENPYGKQLASIVGPGLIRRGPAYGELDLPDGGRINTATEIADNGRKAFLVNWVSHHRTATRGRRMPLRTYGTFMSPEEYAAWHATVDPEHHAHLLPPETPKKTKLARAPDPLTHEALISEAIRTKDPIALGVLADHVDETGLPGSSLLRMAQRQGLAHGSTLIPSGYRSEPPHSVGHGISTGDWVGENGAASQNEYVPHSLEAYPMLGWHGLGLTVAHTGASQGEAHRLIYPVRIHNKAEYAEAISTLPEAMQAALKASIQAVARERFRNTRRRPWRFGREALTWVGGSVPGGRPAVGAWTGGTERSSVVRLPGEKAQALAIALAQRNKQKSALWFTPGEGPDQLHVLHVQDRPASVRKGLNAHGVSYMTLIPEAGGTTVHVVDTGGQLAGPVKAFAAQSRARLESTPGTAGYQQLRLHRVGEPERHDSLLREARDSRATHPLGVFGDWLKDQGAPGGELAIEAAQNPDLEPFAGTYTGRAGGLGRYHDYESPPPRSQTMWVHEDGGPEGGAIGPVPYGQIGVGVHRYRSARDPHPNGYLGSLYVIHAPKSPAPGASLAYHVEVRDAEHLKRVTRDLPLQMRFKIAKALLPQKPVR